MSGTDSSLLMDWYINGIRSLFHFSFHLLPFLRSVQDYKIHMDMEIVIFLESRGETNLEAYSNHMVQYSI